ncbi:MAG: transporter substrate-binding domain-containing protein [Burkholderiales bacterium]|nr:transporter substrate-binding domain-containing protein [Burkholderiales bacterium]
MIVAFAGQQASQAAEVLAVGTEFAHVFERTPAGEFTGLGVDILKALAKRNGDTLRFEIYPWSRAQWMAENDQAQILVGPYKTPEREVRFSFARRAFYRDYMVFYVRSGSNLDWDGNYASLRAYKVGVILGWVYGAQFDGMRALLKPETANSLTNGLNMLNARRIDYLASNMRNTEAMIKTLGLSNDFYVVDTTIDIQDGYLAYCKQAACEQLRLRYDEAFEQLVESGELAKLARKHKVRIP